MASQVWPRSCECQGTSDWAELEAAERAGPAVAAATEARMTARMAATESVHV